MITVTFVTVEGTSGMIKASTTRSPVVPLTAPTESVTAHPGGADHQPRPRGARPAADPRTRRSARRGGRSAAVAVTSLLPGTPRSSHHPTAPLAAWTDAKPSDGPLHVTLRPLSKPHGL